MMKKWLILALVIVSTGLVTILYVSREDQKIIKQIPLTGGAGLDSIVSDSFSLDPEDRNPVLEPACLSCKHFPQDDLYSVIKVVDGDTIDVSINGQIERLRLIGINTPETVDPRKPVECFGREASDRARALLDGKKVLLESDPNQGERDKYSRLLRYVFLESGENFNLMMVQDGYAYEYTYDTPYKYQDEFKGAQRYAETNRLGLWGACCASQTCTETASLSNSCNIKGNISSNRAKIYHVPGCGSYEKTIIDESAGEKWFCSEEEAVKAGWRKAKNC